MPASSSRPTNWRQGIHRLQPNGISRAFTSVWRKLDAAQKPKPRKQRRRG